MSKLEKRLCFAALIFVIIYGGAIALTLHYRAPAQPANLQYESGKLDVGTRHMVLAEVLAPMLVLLTMTVCFVVVRKKQQRARQRMDNFVEETPEPEDTPQNP